ncbi:MAG: hypothetical protein C0506_05395 [Anaerolinea sp.]|nr:hypothetical protein [Anaerolinea sp.]
MPRSWLADLRAAGFEATLWSDVGPRDAGDDTICAWAFANGHVVLTYDLDFGTILQSTGAVGPSVVILRARDGRPQRARADVYLVLSKFRFALEEGALIIIDHLHHRVRMLPLAR